MSRWCRLFHDPQPRNDWSTHLEEGGVVLLGVVRESERWTTEGGKMLGGDEELTFVRVPLSPEVLTR
jgi:hypothetical protein